MSTGRTKHDEGGRTHGQLSGPKRLGNLELFSGRSARDLREVDASATSVVVSAARVLCEEGDVGREFFVLLDDRRRCVQQAPRRIARVDQWFGEVALCMPGRRRTASVRTTKPLMCCPSTLVTWVRVRR